MYNSFVYTNNLGGVAKSMFFRHIQNWCKRKLN